MIKSEVYDSYKAKSPKHLCFLYFNDHFFHQIIQRQLSALTTQNLLKVTVIDENFQSRNDLSYGHIPLQRAKLVLFSKWLWWLLKKVLPEHYRYKYWLFVSELQIWATTLRFLFTCLHVKADIYQAHDIETLPVAYLAARWHKGRVVYDSHELASERGDLVSTHNKIIRLLERYLLSRIDNLIVPNTIRASYYLKKHELRNQPIVVLNCSYYEVWERNADLRDLLGLTNDTKLVLYHGILIPGRALEDLMLATRSFQSNIKLIIIGDQNEYYHTCLLPLWQKNNLSKNVFFIPYMPFTEIKKYVNSADLGVVIYKNINLNNFYCAPTKLYEFIMAKIPVAACNFPEMVTLFEQYPLGVLFDPDDQNSIAEAVNSFFALPTSCLKEIQEGLLKAREDFNWETEYKKLYTLWLL